MNTTDTGKWAKEFLAHMKSILPAHPELRGSHQFMAGYPGPYEYGTKRTLAPCFIKWLQRDTAIACAEWLDEP